MSDELKRVLIVEDDPDLQHVYQMILTMQGYSVAVAGNGIEALKAVARKQPDVILLDVLMPLMDGRDFLRNLDTDLYDKMCIIILSNLADQEVIDEMLQLGADRHFLKSDVTPNTLIDLVENTANC